MKSLIVRAIMSIARSIVLRVSGYDYIPALVPVEILVASNNLAPYLLSKYAGNMPAPSAKSPEWALVCAAWHGVSMVSASADNLSDAVH